MRDSVRPLPLFSRPPWASGGRLPPSPFSTLWLICSLCKLLRVRKREDERPRQSSPRVCRNAFGLNGFTASHGRLVNICFFYLLIFLIHPDCFQQFDPSLSLRQLVQCRMYVVRAAGRRVSETYNKIKDMFTQSQISLTKTLHNFVRF